jgi:hypothetical protein
MQWEAILKAINNLIDRRHERDWAEAGKGSSKHGTLGTPKSQKTIASAHHRLELAGVRLLKLIDAPLTTEHIRQVTDLETLSREFVE